MITFECPSCSAKLQAEEKYAGEKIKCPECQAMATVPGDDSTAMTDAPRSSGSGRARDDDDDRPRRRPDRSEEDVKPKGMSGMAIVLLVLGVSGAVGLCVCLIGGALFFPAIMKVREAAARTQSTNNLKNIVLGAQGYHDAFKHFPFNGTGAAMGGVPNSGSWAFQILPFIEQDPMFRTVDRSRPVPPFLCPGRSRPGVETSNGGGAWTDYFYNNYLNNAGNASKPDNTNGKRTLGSIAAGDGSSFTVFAGHGNINLQDYASSGNVTLSTNIFMGGTFGTARAGNDGGVNPTGVKLQRDSDTNPDFASWGGPFPQGALMGMCDATVRVFPYHTQNFGAFLTPSGGEKVVLPD